MSLSETNDADRKLRQALRGIDPKKRVKIGRVADYWPTTAEWSSKVMSSPVVFDPSVEKPASCDGKRIVLGFLVFRFLDESRRLGQAFLAACDQLDATYGGRTPKRYDKTPGAPEAPAAPKPPGPGGPAAAQPKLQVGTTKTFGGHEYRLNENHRWERADGNEPDAPPSTAGRPPADAPEAGHAERHAYVAKQLASVSGPAKGLMAAFHESPEYKSGGEYSTHDVHPKQAAALYSWLQQNAGKDSGGGKVVDLGNGQYGFATPAGSMVIGQAEGGKHQVHYTNKTGIVARGMAGGGDAMPAQAPGAAAAQAGGATPAQADDGQVIATEPGAPPVQEPAAPPVQSGEKPPPLPEAAKPPPVKSKLQARAEQSRRQLDGAIDAWEKHMASGGDQRMNARFRSHIASLKRVWSEHDQAARAEARDAEQASKKAESARRQAEREAQRKAGVKKAEPKAQGQPAKEAAAKLDAEVAKGEPTGMLTRQFKAGYNSGSIEFADDNHRDLHDLGAKMRRQVTAKNPSSADRDGIARLRESLGKRLGMDPAAVSSLAADVHKDTSRQAKGIQDGEHRKLTMPKAAGGDAPLLDSPGGGPVPESTPEARAKLALPKRQQRLMHRASGHFAEHGIEASDHSKAAIDNAVKKGWVRTTAGLKAVFRTAAKLKGRKVKGSRVDVDGKRVALDDHDALKMAIRRQASRESRESVQAVTKRQAAAWDMKPEEYHSMAREMWPQYLKQHDVREAAKSNARKLTGLTAKKIHEIEHAGRDYSTVPHFDEYAQEIASEYGDLGWHPDENHEERLWELIKEGKRHQPGRASPEFHKFMDDYLSQQQNAAVGPVPTREELDAVPFAKTGRSERIPLE